MRCPGSRRQGRSAEERRGDAGVDRDVQARGLRQVTAAQREDRRRDVLGQHLLAATRLAPLKRFIHAWARNGRTV